MLSLLQMTSVSRMTEFLEKKFKFFKILIKFCKFDVQRRHGSKNNARLCCKIAVKFQLTEQNENKYTR